MIESSSAATILEWTGSVLGMIGALLLATYHRRYAKFGWLAFLLANFSVIGFSYMKEAYGLLTQQSFFVVTSCLGLYRSGFFRISKSHQEDQS